MNEVEKMYENAGIECDLPCQKRGVECIDNLAENDKGKFEWSQG